MNRRELLQRGGCLAAAAALGLALPVRTWAALPAAAGAEPGDESLLDLLGDTILPATPESPGAGSVGIGRFILTMVADCHPPADAALLRRALAEIEAASRAVHGRNFAALNATEREAVLVAYEQKCATAARRAENPFLLLKELTLAGYFTSEPGATLALRYDPVPGGFRGSVPLAPGDRSWAL